MATADELLAANVETDDVFLSADLENRRISIPASITLLGVESDDDVRRLNFKVPRHYGEFDLSEFDIRVNFKNARGKGDVYPVNDKVVNTDNFTFSWLVDRSALQYAGEVIFNICMKKYDADGVVVKEFNTTTATLPVLSGLETDKAAVDNNPSILDQILFRLYAVEAANAIGRNGYYSIVKMSESEDGVVFTIVNQDGETEAVVRHGKDAYTPVYGTDYWTPTQEAEIKAEAANHAKEYVETWAPRKTTVTLSTANWVDNTQTVVAEGVIADDRCIVIPAPEPSNDNYTAYTEQQVRCIAQGDGTLTFQCESAPSVDLIVNVAIYFSNDSDDAGTMTVVDDGEGNVTIM